MGVDLLRNLRESAFHEGWAAQDLSFGGYVSCAAVVLNRAVGIHEQEYVFRHDGHRVSGERAAELLGI